MSDSERNFVDLYAVAFTFFLNWGRRSAGHRVSETSATSSYLNGWGRSGSYFYQSGTSNSYGHHTRSSVRSDKSDGSESNDFGWSRYYHRYI